jgi:hypothetical protein
VWWETVVALLNCCHGTEENHEKFRILGISAKTGAEYESAACWLGQFTRWEADVNKKWNGVD